MRNSPAASLFGVLVGMNSVDTSDQVEPRSSGVSPGTCTTPQSIPASVLNLERHSPSNTMAILPCLNESWSDM
ncbi:hypothetical protein D3C87_2129840 [compost metagenome]